MKLPAILCTVLLQLLVEVSADDFVTLCVNRCTNYTLQELPNSLELRTTRRLTVVDGNVSVFDRSLISAFGRLNYLEVWPQRSRSVDRFFIPMYLRTLILRRTGVHRLDIPAAAVAADRAYQLRVLYAADNRLGDVSSLRYLRHLHTINLNNNRLQHLSWKVFAELDELKDLSLRGNELRKVGAVRLPASLVRLNLSNNRLRSVDVGSWTILANLELLELEGNKLERIEGAGLQGFEALSKVSLRGNPWDCDWLNQTLRWMESRKVALVGGLDLVCSAASGATRIGKLCCRRSAALVE